jgi:AcrR family transcriptional regulator
MADPRHKSVRVSKRADRRVQRTQRELGMAFAELLTRRSYHSIRVSDITRKAAVGRATFYAHFDRKEDLLRTQLGGVIDAYVKVPPKAPWRLDATGLFAHIQEIPQMYRTFMHGPSAKEVIAMARDIVEQRICAALQSGAIAVPVEPPAMLARHAAASLFDLLDWWFEHDMPMTPAQINTAYQALLPAVEAT